MEKEVADHGVQEKCLMHILESVLFVFRHVCHINAETNVCEGNRQTFTMIIRAEGVLRLVWTSEGRHTFTLHTLKRVCVCLAAVFIGKAQRQRKVLFVCLFAP